MIATGLFGAKALAGEPEKPVIVADSNSVKAGTPGDTQAFSYTLAVNSTNLFVGDAVLITLTDSKGELAKGRKVNITDPSGNTFQVSIDNLQNGFVAKVSGDYLIEYGKEKVVVTVREMDAELKSLQKFPVDTIREIVVNTASADSHLFDSKNLTLTVLNSKNEAVLDSVDISKLNSLYVKATGRGIVDVRVGAIPGKPFQIVVVPVAQKDGEIDSNTPFIIFEYNEKLQGFERGYALTF